MNDSKRRVLVVDDEPAMREVLRERLAQWGWSVETAEDAESGLSTLEAFDPDVVLCDVVLPDVSGIQLVSLLRASDEDLPVVLMTAHGSVDMAVEAMKEGAYDFLTKPLDYDHLETVLAVAREELERRERSTRRAAAADEPELHFEKMVGRSDAMKRVFEKIREVADVEATVLVTGESGTGKELVARAIHARSDRSEGPFVAINMAALPGELVESELFGHEQGAFTGARERRRGCFELAHRGTLLLDEIAEMPVEVQPKLLRVLEDGKVRRVGGDAEHDFDVRVIASTNRDPRAAIEEERLREDLYFRLDVFSIELPPLRERPDDVSLLAHHFLEAFADKHGAEVRGFADEALERLEAYRWPGNVRELRNVVERAVVLARDGWIEVGHLPPYVGGNGGDEAPDDTIPIPADASLEDVEKRLILETLERTGNNKAETARRLGVDVKTIRNKLKRYGET